MTGCASKQEMTAMSHLWAEILMRGLSLEIRCQSPYFLTLSQLLPQLNTPLIKRINPPDDAFDKHLVLIQRD